MSNSKLVSYVKKSPHFNKRNHRIDTISIHCMAGNLSVETCGNVFQTKQASSNYGIGSDGRIALYVDEENRSWCTSSASNDHRAVTIEVANDGGAPNWHVSDKAYAALLDLLTDICRRNGIKRLLWKGDKNLIGQVDKQNMTVHRWFANKACPGDYLYSKHGEIAAEVNRRLRAAEITPTVKPDTPTAKPVTPTKAAKVDAAEKFDRSAAKGYTVNAESGLWLRAGAGTGKDKIALLPHGLRVNCYGYYTNDAGVKWLLIKVTDSRPQYRELRGKTGFSSSKYLK